MKAFYTLILVLLAGAAYGQSNLPECPKDVNSNWTNCFGAFINIIGDKYLGEFVNNAYNGQGILIYAGFKTGWIKSRRRRSP